MYTINERRFLKDLNALAAIGIVPEAQGGGRDRRAFSAPEREARRLFANLARESGLQVTTDPAGNVSARWASTVPQAKTLLVGSHFDTVPNGGPYDGALGVIAGLEAIRILKESGESLPVSIECIAFADEEGRYAGLTGSQLAAGTYSRDATERFLSAISHFPADLNAMSEFLPAPLTVDTLLSARRSADQLMAFLELHIEQGPQLEHNGKTIGIVDAIFGRASCQVVLTGRSDHAGTTPMTLRADALEGAADFILYMSKFVRTECRGAVFTCGNIAVSPGADNVVPGEARVWVEYRANTTEMLDCIGAEVDESLDTIALSRGLDRIIEGYQRLDPRPMAPVIRAQIRESCEALGYSSMELSSGALHDAHSMAAIVPAGMLFVPSIGGRSHCPQEDTAAADLVAGANALLRTLEGLAREGVSR